MDTPTLNLWGTNMAAPTLVTLKPPFLGSLPSDGSGDVVPVAVRGGPQLLCFPPPPPPHTWGGLWVSGAFLLFSMWFYFLCCCSGGLCKKGGKLFMLA